MSFNELIVADHSRKKTPVVLKAGEKEYTFYAVEMSFLQRVNVAVIQQNGGDAFTQLVINSIVDEQGQHMTKEQASRLSDEHMEVLFVAASEVNKTAKAAEKN